MQLLSTILDAGRTQGLSQKVVAARAGLPEETLSRMKSRSSIKTDVLQKLARAVGLELALTARPASPIKPDPLRLPFVQKYKALVWSNQNARPEIFIRKALLQPDFSVLLDAAEEFGVPKLQQEWQVLEIEGTPEVQRATPVTKRMLTHMGAKF